MCVPSTLIIMRPFILNWGTSRLDFNNYRALFRFIICCLERVRSTIQCLKRRHSVAFRNVDHTQPIAETMASHASWPHWWSQITMLPTTPSSWMDGSKEWSVRILQGPLITNRIGKGCSRPAGKCDAGRYHKQPHNLAHYALTPTRRKTGWS